MGDLHDFSISHQIGPAVADVHHITFILFYVSHHQGRGHSGILPILRCHPANFIVGSGDTLQKISLQLIFIGHRF